METNLKINPDIQYDVLDEFNPVNGSCLEVVDENCDLQEYPVIELDEKHFAVKFYIFENCDQKGITFTGKLYFPAILDALRELGYYKKQREKGEFFFVRERDNIIKEVEPSFTKDEFYTAHLKNLEQPLFFVVDDLPITLSIEAQQQAYLKQANQVFNKKFLEHLDTHEKPILEDDQYNSYFFFKNRISITNRSELKTMEYSELDNACVWEDHMIDHEFNYDQDFQDAHYPTFIRNVARGETSRLDAFHSAIGYMLNNYISPSRSQAIICYDEVPSDIGEPNGGTGKGVFCKAINQLRNTYKLDGKNIRSDDKFKFQGITERTQVFWIDDIAENFPFEMLHSAITDGFTVEKKYHHQFCIPAEKSPKIILCSNTILSEGGKTNIRRQFILEFSDYYSKKIITGAEEPIMEEHGGLFFDKESWDGAEWSKFFSFMIWCAWFYMQEGLKPYTQVGMERSRLIQMTSPEFNEWVAQRELKINEEYENNALFN